MLTFRGKKIHDSPTRVELIRRMHTWRWYGQSRPFRGEEWGSDLFPTYEESVPESTSDFKAISTNTGCPFSGGDPVAMTVVFAIVVVRASRMENGTAYIRALYA